MRRNIACTSRSTPNWRSRRRKPDLVIYLQAPVDVLLARIGRRGIQHEQFIDRGYLERLNDAYARFFHEYDAGPLLIVNAAAIDPVNTRRRTTTSCWRRFDACAVGASTTIRCGTRRYRSCRMYTQLQLRDSDRPPVTLNTLEQMKQRGEKIACLTAYDASFAALLDAAGVDVVLVGDSLGMVIQGHDTTVPVTMDHMVYHSAAVARGLHRPFLITDLPFMSYPSRELALANSVRLMQEGGARMVKLESGQGQTEIVEFLASHDIAVCAHLGLQAAIGAQDRRFSRPGPRRRGRAAHARGRAGARGRGRGSGAAGVHSGSARPCALPRRSRCR